MFKSQHQEILRTTPNGVVARRLQSAREHDSHPRIEHGLGEMLPTAEPISHFSSLPRVRKHG